MVWIFPPHCCAEGSTRNGKLNPQWLSHLHRFPCCVVGKFHEWYSNEIDNCELHIDTAKPTELKRSPAPRAVQHPWHARPASRKSIRTKRKIIYEKRLWKRSFYSLVFFFYSKTLHFQRFYSRNEKKREQKQKKKFALAKARKTKFTLCWWNVHQSIWKMVNAAKKLSHLPKVHARQSSDRLISMTQRELAWQWRSEMWLRITRKFFG